MTVHYAYCERSADSAHGEQNTGGPEKLQEPNQHFATARQLLRIPQSTRDAPGHGCRLAAGSEILGVACEGHAVVGLIARTVV